MRVTKGLGALALATLAACADDATGPAPTARRAITAPPVGSLAWAGEYQGETGPGSEYSLHVPANWNGKLVVYVHGFVDAALPVALPSIDALRDAIGSAGYAVAYSSFSENGFAFNDGLRRTHQLRGLFASRFGQPTQTLVMGHSLGGLITLALAERYPSQYDGALPMCGVVGGTRRELQYIGDVRALFDYFYPNVLPGDAAELPPITNLNVQILGPAQAAIGANPTGAFVLAGISETPVPGITPTEVVTSVLTALGFHARGLADLTDRAQGKTPYGNDEALYSSTPYASLMGPLNAGVERFSLAANANAWLRNNYEPSGQLAIPVLTLHTTRDPVVPFFHESLLAAQVAQRGAGAMLLQRSISRYGHCTFAIPEMLASLNDLSAWVDTGIKPGA